MYFAATRYGPLGEEHFVGSETTGWRIRYRTYGNKQWLHYAGASRFGALRAVLQRCRQWHGKIFVLHIIAVDPVVIGHYTLPEGE